MNTGRNFNVSKNGNNTDFKLLPEDVGGAHYAYPLSEADTVFGFYIYIPGGYEESPVNYPLLVFLHGDGEQGNSAENIDVLDFVLIHGPPFLISQREWNPSYPMIVVSPQCHDEIWQSEKIDEFIRYVADNFRVDRSRIYLTGLSGGGDGIYRYLAETGNRSPVAAAVVICGEANTCDARKVRRPVWIFHGALDDVVPLQTAVEMKENLINTPEVKLTVYPDIDHGSWYVTYDSTGIGTESEYYDPFDISIYDWMLKYSLSEDNKE